MADDFTPPSVLYGVVRAAGQSPSQSEGVWVSRGVVSDGTLRVDRCAPLAEWIDEPAVPTPALTTFLAGLPETAAVGLDFPFGLPERVVAEGSWREFLLAFPSWVDSPTDLRRRCEARVALADGTTDARFRSTDRPLSAASPFDERIAAATFYGLRDVLRPLVLTDAVRVPPMTPPSPHCPFVVEVYPAGTLVDLDVHVDGYAEEASAATPGDLLDALTAAVGTDLVVDDDARRRVVDETASVESVVAVYAVYRNTRVASALTASDSGSSRLLEGQVYV